MRCIVCSTAISGWLLGSMGCGTSAIAIDSVGEPDAPTPIKVADAEAYKPTPLPDRVILSRTGDPRGRKP